MNTSGQGAQQWVRAGQAGPCLEVGRRTSGRLAEGGGGRDVRFFSEHGTLDLGLKRATVQGLLLSLINTYLPTVVRRC